MDSSWLDLFAEEAEKAAVVAAKRAIWMFIAMLFGSVGIGILIGKYLL